MYLPKRPYEKGSVIIQIWKTLTITLLLIQLTGCATTNWDNVDINQLIENIKAIQEDKP